MATLEEMERTQPDGPAQSHSQDSSGPSSFSREYLTHLVVSQVNRFAVISVVAYQSEALLVLAKSDPRPLLGAGVILAMAMLGFRPGHVVSVIQAWKNKKTH